MIVENLEITRIAHACIKIVTSKQKVIYFDPYQVQEDKADYIFVTHEHYDHCSVADIKKIVKAETVIITVPDCQSKVAGLPIKDVKLVNPGDKLNIDDLEVQVVPAYNTNKHFHPKEQDWVGFVVKVDGKLVYHTGDSDNIPEMKKLTGLDVIFVPVSGTYVMDPTEAAEIINILKPKTAVPIHYGAGVAGTKEDAEKFKSLVHGNVVIL